MFHKNIKLIITAVIVGIAVWQFSEGEIGNGIALILLSLIFVFLYFRNEFILLAFFKLRKQDMAGTQKWLSYIKKPKRALKLGLSMDHDLAMAKLSLAGISMQKRRKREATNLLQEAKKLDKRGMLKEQIKMMQQQMKKI